MSQQDSFVIKDIVNLILKDKAYPINKIIPSYKEIPDPVTIEFRKKLTDTLLVRDRYIEALSYHDLFGQLHGNPQSIVILAAAFSNPFAKVNTLTSLYDQVLLDKNSRQEAEDFESGGDNYNQKGTVIRDNYMSLQACAEASIQLLESASPECLNLLYFLGCLPGGVNRQQLKEMWSDVQEHLDTLKKLSFLDVSEEPKVVVISFIKTYVKSSMAP